MILNYLVYIHDKFLEKLNGFLIILIKPFIPFMVKILEFIIEYPDNVNGKIAEVREENKKIFGNKKRGSR